MSTTLKSWGLGLLRKLNVRSFKATSNLGFPYLCYPGDSLSASRLLNRELDRREILTMVAWCEQRGSASILDVGGHDGFVASQLALALANYCPTIFSFEPVPETFQRLRYSIKSLGLERQVFPVHCALGENTGLVQMRYTIWESMFARVATAPRTATRDERIAWTSTLSMDTIVAAIGGRPDLVKIDVEGYEVHVLRGADALLHGSDPPGLCLEVNPAALQDIGASCALLDRCLAGYDCYFIGDFEGNRLPFGAQIAALDEIDWVCNIFAVPRLPAAAKCWEKVVGMVRA